MEQLVVTRWRRYGKDRLYVNLPGGSRVGWLDLQTGEVTLEREDLRVAFEHAVRDHPAGVQLRTDAPAHDADQPAGGEASPDERPMYSVQVDWRDLAARRPGQAARQQAEQRRRAAPMRTLVARILGLHTDERAWRIGAVGERKVAARLDRLSAEWKVLHALPVDPQGSDIDHLVIGPGGAFTINAKHHPDARIWVGGDAFLVNGSRQPYVRNSRYEAARAARLLSAAAGFAVPVTAVIAVVGAVGGVTIKDQPDGVHIVARKQLHRWLSTRPPILTPEQVTAIFGVARRSDTWQ